MGRLTVEQYEKLCWALSFIQTELNMLLVLEKLNVQGGLETFMGRLKPAFDRTDEGQIKMLAESIAGKEWEKTVKIQETMKNILEKVLSAKGDKPREPILTLPTSKDDLYINGDEIRVKPYYGSDEDMAICKLIRLLSLIPRSAIKTCEGCKRYFLNPTQRKKRFCNVHCTWRYSAKKRREADLEGYRAKQREIMKKRRKKSTKKGE